VRVVAAGLVLGASMTPYAFNTSDVPKKDWHAMVDRHERIILRSIARLENRVRWATSEHFRVA
jgi:hypothetical protein